MLLDAVPITELSSRILDRNVSPVETLQHFLTRIEKLEPTLHAWSTLDRDGALVQARQLEDEISDGRSRGPLHGIPIGVKDIIDTRGLRTSMGSPIFADHVPREDASLIKRLRDAGAIVLGKTVTTEFATLDPGPTRNPWSLGHTPGGSSSGSAAAVAARMCPAATATQTVGSLGRPAAYCGLVGLLPTASRVSAKGVFPVAWSLDHVGAFARSVEDVAIVVRAMCQTPFEATIEPDRIRVGICREFFHEQTEPEAWRHHATFIGQLEKAGMSTVEMKLPDSFRAALAALWTIMRAELALVHQHLHAQHAERYGQTIRGLVESGMLISAPQYVQARRVRRVFQRQMSELFRDCDVILSPGATGPAPQGLRSTGNPLLSAPWTLCDFPTLSLPLTLDSRGMPLGIQVSAPPLEEARLLGIGETLEGSIGFRESPTLQVSSDKA